MFFALYSRLGRKPKYFHLPIVLGLALIDKSYQSGLKSIFRSFHSLRLSEKIDKPGVKLPNIELLCVVAGKDIALLSRNVLAAIQNSNNKITKVTVITREDEVSVCAKVLQSLELEQKIAVISEEDCFENDIMESLKKKFQSRKGWVLQQLLAVNFILKSNNAGVLLLNADTTMLRKVDLLYEDDKQNIYASLEYHRPYYKLLNNLIGSKISPRWTYITHHMLFQPKYFREIFETFELGTMKDLIDWLVLNIDESEQSPLCVEFELYGQGMEILHPELLQHKKFANTSWKRTASNQSKLDLILSGEIPTTYNSVSMHDYLS